MPDLPPPDAIDWGALPDLLSNRQAADALGVKPERVRALYSDRKRKAQKGAQTGPADGLPEPQMIGDLPHHRKEDLRATLEAKDAQKSRTIVLPSAGEGAGGAEMSADHPALPLLLQRAQELAADKRRVETQNAELLRMVEERDKEIARLNADLLRRADESAEKAQTSRRPWWKWW